MVINNFCEKLHKILQSGTRFTVNDFGADKLNKQKINCNKGIYIALQSGETTHGYERIVRVGETTGLYRRIRRHYGNPWNDAFGDNLPNMSHDEMKKFMAENITYRIISTDNDSYRETLKFKIYFAILRCEECNGKFLWQKDKIKYSDKYKFEQEDLDYLENNLL